MQFVDASARTNVIELRSLMELLISLREQRENIDFAPIKRERERGIKLHISPA